MSCVIDMIECCPLETPCCVTTSHIVAGTGVTAVVAMMGLSAIPCLTTPGIVVPLGAVVAAALGYSQLYTCKVKAIVLEKTAQQMHSDVEAVAVEGNRMEQNVHKIEQLARAFLEKIERNEVVEQGSFEQLRQLCTISQANEQEILHLRDHVQSLRDENAAVAIAIKKLTALFNGADALKTSNVEQLAEKLHQLQIGSPETSSSSQITSVHLVNVLQQVEEVMRGLLLELQERNRAQEQLQQQLQQSQSKAEHLNQAIQEMQPVVLSLSQRVTDLDKENAQLRVAQEAALEDDD